jgi:esterase
VMVDGTPRLHTLVWSTPGPAESTVVLLHGGGLQAHTWDPVCLALRDAHHCVSADLRGHGDSEWALDGNYGLDALADDLARVVDALAPGGAVVVGHSLGGMAAMQYAARRPAKIRGVVLVDVGPRIRKSGSERIRSFIRSRRDFDSMEQLVEHVLQFAPTRRSELLAYSLRHNTRPLPQGGLTWKYDPLPFEQDVDRTASLWQAALAIECPVLIVRGEHSKVFLEDDAVELAHSIADARLETLNTGHTVQGDDPRGLADSIRRFIDSALDRGE